MPEYEECFVPCISTNAFLLNDRNIHNNSKNLSEFFDSTIIAHNKAMAEQERLIPFFPLGEYVFVSGSWLGRGPNQILFHRGDCAWVMSRPKKNQSPMNENRWSAWNLPSHTATIIVECDENVWFVCTTRKQTRKYIKNYIECAYFENRSLCHVEKRSMGVYVMQSSANYHRILSREDAMNHMHRDSCWW